MQQQHTTTPLSIRTGSIPLLAIGAFLFLVCSVSAGTGITIAADGDQSYNLGEKITLRGQSAGEDTVYLFMTGPNVPGPGVKLMSPKEVVTSGNSDSFTVVKAKPDKSWEYSFYTANLLLDSGTYSVYAMTRPEPTSTPGPGAANVSFIIRRPFIYGNNAPISIQKGQAFTITESVFGEPASVQIWILGDNYAMTTKSPVKPDGTLTYTADATITGKLPTGQNYLFLQHPMQNNQFDIVSDGEYATYLQQSGTRTKLFRLSGPGSLQAGDAADALIAALTSPDMKDDSYLVIPFQVTEPGTAGDASISSPPADSIKKAPEQTPARKTPLGYAVMGAIVLVTVIAAARRKELSGP